MRRALIMAVAYAAAGLAVHPGGVALAAWTLVRLARAKRPASFAIWSVAAWANSSAD